MLKKTENLEPQRCSQVRIAIVGTGQRARSYARTCSSTENAQLTALCDINRERLEAFANDRSLFRDADVTVNYTDLDELLDDDICDAVVIAVPDAFHREVAEKAFAAGKHCILEKPMALTEEDCRAIIAAKEKSGCILQMGFVLRYTPFYKKIKSIIDSGVFGQIMAIEACGFLSIPHSVSYMRRWHRKKANCGSFILAKCSHDLDLLSWLINGNARKVASFGGNDFFLPSKQASSHCSSCPEKQLCPYEFTKQSNNFVVIDENAKKDLSKYDFDLCVFNNDKDIVDNQVVIIEYEDKIRAQFSLQCFYPGSNERIIRINGSEAYLEGRFSQNRIKLSKSQTGEKTTIDLSSMISQGGGHSGGNGPFFEEFINCIIENKEPEADLNAGLNSNLLAKAIDISMLEGKVVTL